MRVLGSIRAFDVRKPIDRPSIGLLRGNSEEQALIRVRRIYAVDLWEISIVTFPMLAGARVRAVKRSQARTRAEQNGRARRAFKTHRRFAVPH